MAISAFIPKVWSARLLDNLNRSLVFGRLCSHAWEGDITQWGDTVHIGSVNDVTVHTYTPGAEIEDPEELDGTDRTLLIDHGVYYNFCLNDVDAAQARADLMDAAMRSAARRLAEDTEDYLIGTIRSGAGIKKTAAIPEGGVYALLVQLKTDMDLKHVPREGRKAVIPPDLEAEMLLDSRFITATSAGNSRLEEGSVGRAAGFDLYVSTALTNEIIALIPDAVAFASQLTRTEAYRREKGFEDGVKGLSLCGAKVVLPDAVAVLTVGDAA